MALVEFFSQFRSLLFGSEDLLKNRRHQPRLALDLPVVVSLDGRLQTALVRDFGPNGLRLQMGMKLTKGRPLRVQVMPDSGLEGSSSLTCRVAWCRAVDNVFHLGCKYDDKPEVLAASWVQMLLRERHQRNRDRRDRRVEATIPAILLGSVGQPLQVFVLDLSLGGARVFSPQPWTPNQSPRLSLNIPGQGASFDFAVEVVESRPMDNSGFTYRLRFRDSDSKRMNLLRRLLMHLLEGVRKAGRSRPTDLITATPSVSGAGRTKARSTQVGKLGEAVQAPPGKDPRQGISSYLKAPELPPRKARAAAPPAPVAEKKERSKPAVESQPTERLLKTLTRPMQAGALPEDSRLRRCGWLCVGLDGWHPVGDLVNDFLMRPTRDFFRCLNPMLWGASLGLAPSMVETDLDRGFALGPGLIWTDRAALGRWWTARRNLVGWVEQMMWTRERLERRSSNLRQRAFQLLSLLACGGPPAIRQMLVCGQVAVGIARHSGMTDPLVLNQLRLAALLKDIGEAILFVGGQNQAMRERYALHINGLEFGEPEIAELSADWRGFSCPNDLLINRLRMDAVTLELLPYHPTLAELLLTRLGFPVEMRSAIRSHHEAWSGLGYPEGLRGEDIPWSARCLALADGFASGLSFSDAPDRAFTQVSQLKGSYYDPAQVDHLQSYLKEMKVLS